MRRANLFLGLLLLLPATARAGRRPFLYAQDATMVPEGDVEVEFWLDFIDVQTDQPDKWRVWLGPRWAPFEWIEVSALTIWQQTGPGATSAPGAGSLWAEQLEARLRALKLGERGALFGQIDYRIAIQATIANQVVPGLGIAGRWHRFDGTAQVGYAHGFGGIDPTIMGPDKGLRDSNAIPFRAGLAVDVIRGEIAPPLQLGVEIAGEALLDGLNDFNKTDHSHANLGPTVSAARGRLWLTTGVLFPLVEHQPSPFFRLLIGVAL